MDLCNRHLVTKASRKQTNMMIFSVECILITINYFFMMVATSSSGVVSSMFHILKQKWFPSYVNFS